MKPQRRQISLRGLRDSCAQYQSGRIWFRV